MIEFIKDNFLYITAIITSIKWVYEYSNKLNWEKNKFLIDRLEVFFNDTNTKNIQLVLDWNKIKINDGQENYLIDDDILFEALQTHDIKHKFDKTEIFLRNSFDEYFDKLTEFIILAESGMISKRNLRMFLNYWFNILGGNKKSKPSKLINQFKVYMLFYGYEKLFKFLNNKNNFKFHFNIKK
jgi:hypothetical protein